MDRSTAHDRPTATVRFSSPYRDTRDELADRVRELERESSALRALVSFLLFVSLLLAGLAAWWFAALCSMTR
jgi:hypothetical protein